ncbi:hypothetical protein, partial [Moorena sp. SIO2C4]|uniref:hypothetical protein n=1 Tax=Moorena sp. SIO2C4 TaxID=2607824 RepID=UPI0013CD8A95
ALRGGLFQPGAKRLKIRASPPLTHPTQLPVPDSRFPIPDSRFPLYKNKKALPKRRALLSNLAN